MKKLVYGVFLLSVGIFAQTSTENYIKSTTYKVPTRNGVNISEDNKIESVNYFDGLGRPKQQIAVRAGGSKEDLITPIIYDAYGRQVREYLPFSRSYTTAANSLNYATNLHANNQGNILAIHAQYKNKYQEDFIGINDNNEINPYAEKRFEDSPLNRVLEQAAPGKDWKLSEGHTIKMSYDANVFSDGVKIFGVNLTTEHPELINSSIYQTGELYKTITKDENWTATQADARAHTTEEYKNKQGQVVLKRTYGNVGSNTDILRHDTYYVYDDYNNLTFVLPPKIDASETDITSLRNLLPELGYQYKYDARNRLIEKQIPGKEKEFVVYNKIDQAVLTQDANLKRTGSGRWLFTKYDAFGRVAYTGYTNNNANITAMQRYADTGNYTQWETKTATSSFSSSGTGVFYSKTAIPTGVHGVYTINYYDTYTDLPSDLQETVTTSFGVTSTTNTQGLPTVSKVRVLETNNWITTVTYYDDKARPIYIYSKNDYLNTVDIVENQLDFVGKVLKTRTRHQQADQQEIVTLVAYEYDHMDRILNQYQCVGDDSLANDCTGGISNNLTLNSETLKGDYTATESITILGETLITGESYFYITDTNGTNTSNKELIVANTYDELGQLESKKVGNTTSKPLQNVNYSYNIRGWLKGINKDATGNDLFNFAITYNNPTNGNNALYNGNISETSWGSLSVNPSNNAKSTKYTYSYDALNRIKSAIDNTGHYNLEDVSYDKNGNIESLSRKGNLGSGNSFGVIDNLAYTYNSGNKLQKVADITNHLEGFKDGANANTEYVYDANGNMTQDLNKGITNISYNHLNLPKRVTIGGQEINYTYDATGVKLSKTVQGVTTQYAGNYIYKNNALEFFNHPEGYVQKSNGKFSYVYQYKDIWRNTRLTYTDSNNDGTIDPATEILREQNYYPFGLEHKGYNNIIVGIKNNLKQYQGQEFTEDLGLNTHEWKYRVSDPAIGRFWQIDPLAEDYVYNSTYAFQENKMGMGVELEGLELGDFPDPFESDIGNQESENRLMAQISAGGMAILSEIGSFFDNFFVKGSATVSKDVTNSSGENGGTSTTVETTHSAEVGTNFKSFFSNYTVSSDGTVNFNSNPIVAETSTKVTSTSKIKTSIKLTPLVDATFTGQLKTDLGNGQTTVSGMATLGIKDNGLFVSGSENLSTGSSKVEVGLRAGAKTPKVKGFSFSAKGIFGFRSTLDDNNP